MTINALLFMFMVEFMLVSTGILIFLYVKYRRLKENGRKGGGSVSDEFKDNLKNELNMIAAEIEDLEKSDRKDDDKKLTVSSLSAKRQFLSAVIMGLENSEEVDEDTAWQAVLKRHDDITAKLFNSIKTANKDRKLLKSLARQLRIQSAQLEEYKNKVVETTEKINNMNRANKELTDTLQMLIPEAEMSAELKEALSRAESSKNELDTCLSTLEEENLRLTEEAGKDKSEINQLSDLADNMANEYNTLLKQKKALEQKHKAINEEMNNKNKDLEKKLEEKEKALTALQENFKTLEEEYERLYEETKGDENA